MGVLRSFIASANAQYRDAGLDQYQMEVKRDGSVRFPNRPEPRFKSAGAAPQPAAAGANAATGVPAQAASSAPAQATSGAAQVTRSGAAPRPTDLKETKDGFQLAWQPVAGARQYGIWQDGVLIGHVTKPQFAGVLAAGASGTIQVDAVLAGGVRTELTNVLRVVRGADGKVSFEVPGAAPPAAAGAPTAPAAAAR